MANKSGIHIKPENEGKFREKMHGKEGKNLSIEAMKAKLAAAQKSGDAETARQANFAINARRWHHGGKKK